MNDKEYDFLTESVLKGLNRELFYKNYHWLAERGERELKEWIAEDEKSEADFERAWLQDEERGKRTAEEQSRREYLAYLQTDSKLMNRVFSKYPQLIRMIDELDESEIKDLEKVLNIYCA